MNAVSLDEVIARTDVWRGDHLAEAGLPAVASGFAALDAELPGGGWARGSLAELLTDSAGHGECSVLFPALTTVQAEGKWIVLVAPPHAAHAPALALARIDLSRLVVVAPDNARDALWAAEQALASGAPGAVVCWAARIDAGQVRRLQVAAAGSSSLAFLFRPSRAAGESSAAPLRLQLAATAHGRLGVQLLKRRGPPCRRTL
ncbi:translesion DNA synthesis-associated protein ImuA [Propionivibrio limicola]|uniref:translesion DNA synthesis-associated protein ImuA n=1 Tax=Propionivibrio limicola TaxID=167645 RepID=UPI0014783A5B|nr:translesion DNA synthesis-associated protein ImuA [Propionivibrio limicola]